MNRDDQLEGIFPFIVQNMALSCCQRCQAYGTTVVHFIGNDTNRPSEKGDLNEVRSSVEESSLSFPLFGYKGQQQFLGEFGFLSIVESPAVVFIVPKEDSSKSSLRLLSSLFNCWPVLLINSGIVLLSGIIIWHLVSYLKKHKNDIMTTLHRRFSASCMLHITNETLRIPTAAGQLAIYKARRRSIRDYQKQILVAVVAKRGI